MVVREVVPGVFHVGVIDWDRRIFDDLIPLPDGTSYNAYLIQGSEKTALIDTVDPTKEFDFIFNLVTLGVEAIDYLVVNHAEQDHAGTVPMILELYPQARVLCTEKCRDLLVALLEIDPERVDVVADGHQVSLGDRTLEFLHAPFVHWPETMLTYLREDRILFPCDLFGSHYATSALAVEDFAAIRPAAKRYYAEIMMPFRGKIRNYLVRLEKYPIATIAPSHGPIYRSPDLITGAYRQWTSDEVSNLVIIPYVTMHGSTGKMVEYLAGALIHRGIDVIPYNLTKTDLGALASSLVDAATIIIGCPTVLFGPHPSAVSAAYVTNLLRPKARFATVIGSYGWGGKTVELVKGLLPNLHAEFLNPVMVRGTPTQEDLRALDQLADDILMKHREAGIIGEKPDDTDV